MTKLSERLLKSAGKAVQVETRPIRSTGGYLRKQSGPSLSSRLLGSRKDETSAVVEEENTRRITRSAVKPIPKKRGRPRRHSLDTSAPTQERKRARSPSPANRTRSQKAKTAPTTPNIPSTRSTPRSTVQKTRSSATASTRSTPRSTSQEPRTTRSASTRSTPRSTSQKPRPTRSSATASTRSTPRSTTQKPRTTRSSATKSSRSTTSSRNTTRSSKTASKSAPCSPQTKRPSSVDSLVIQDSCSDQESDEQDVSSDEYPSDTMAASHSEEGVSESSSESSSSSEEEEEAVEESEDEKRYTRSSRRHVQKETPRLSHRIIKSAPSTPLSSQGQTPLDLAREQLHLSARPKTMPGREFEYSQIHDVLESAIADGEGCCIYISGVPGTGKTATVHRVLESLERKVAEKKLRDFDCEEINGMKLSDPQQAYVVLCQTLTGKKVSGPHAAEILEKRYSCKTLGKVKPCVLLIDELDQLVTRNQKVMYNFFDWPNRPNSSLIVLAISNTIDLPERVLLNRVSSRLGLSRIEFKSYNHQQLIKIVESRLRGIGQEDEGFEADEELELMDQDSIVYCARKVSSVSGDARKALDICRRAIEILQERIQSGQETESVVRMEHVNMAIKEIFATPSLQALSHASLHQKIFMGAMVRRLRITGKSDLTFYEIVQEHEKICRSFSVKCPPLNALSTLCSQLGVYRWILVENATCRDSQQRIKLNLMEEDVIATLNKEQSQESGRSKSAGQGAGFLKKLLN